MLETLEYDECLRLLGSVPIGRVAFTSAALPWVLPVTFALHGDVVVFRTHPGSKLDVALRNAIVAFEVDEYDTEHRRGWSVTVVGPAALVTDQDRLEELAGLDLVPWAPGPHDHVVTITIEMLHGRRISDDRLSVSEARACD